MMIFSKPIVVFDFETNLITSKKPFPEPIECGAIKLDRGYDRLDSYHTFIKNKKDALLNEITSITQEEIDTGIVEYEFLKQFSKFCAGCYICAFNLPYDLGILKTTAARNNFELFIGTKIIDLKTLCHFTQDHWGYKTKNTSLGGFYERYLEEPLKQSHRAMDDVEAAIKILRFVAERYE